MKSHRLLDHEPDIAETRLNEDRGGGGRCRVSAVGPPRHGTARRILITLQVDVVDARFAGLDTIHYLPKLFVFDLQCIADQ